MRPISILLTASIALLCSCSNNQEATISILANTSSSDSVQLTHLMTGVSLATLSAVPGTAHELNLTEPQIVQGTSSEEHSVLLVIEPGQTKQLTIDSLGIHSTAVADTLLNYLHTSSNEVLRQYGGLIFGEGAGSQVRGVFDSLLQARNQLIERASISGEAKALLTYQNKARVFNFLFYYGRMIHNLSPTDSFFNFTEQISYQEPYYRTSPHIVLYKLEVDYLKKHDAITSVHDFAEYLNAEIEGTEDGDFLRAFYLKELMDSPQYWEKHNQVFNSIELKKILAEEINNPFSFLFQKGSIRYFNTMEGEKAYLFTALRADSSTFQMESQLNKLIVLDVWATWCGPCLQQKPYFQQVAAELKEEKVAFVSVSTDKSFVKWKQFLDKKPAFDGVEEVNVSEGVREFREGYNVQSIPRYVLIGSDGRIIDADMEDPGAGMIERIKQHLSLDADD